MTTSSDTYASNAEFWVEIIRGRLDRYRVELTDAVVLNALGDVAGRRVLDGGCGEGYLSRELCRRGATVTGIDISASLISAANRERESLQLDSLVHYEASLESIPEPADVFDSAVCNHVMTDVADPAAAIKEISRVTKPGGKLVILMLHPCFYTAHSERNASGTIDVDTYFSDRSIRQPFQVAGIVSPGEVSMTFRPLEYYMSAITGSGYAITQITEPHPTGLQREDTWWQRNFVKPLFMLIVAKKLG